MKSNQIIDDIGILASIDPVAIDSATMDIIKTNTGQRIEKLSYPKLDGWIQIKHAEQLGMGTSNFDLVEL